MPLKLIVTKDGSHTIEGAGGITYHSTFGALQESRHIFINAGLRAAAGFGSADWGSGSGDLGFGSAGWGSGSGDSGFGSADWGSGSGDLGFGSAGWGSGMQDAPAFGAAVPESDAAISPLRIFEMGLGTGLNALLSMLEAADTGKRILYEAVETTPLPLSMIRDLNYCSLLGRPEWEPLFEQLHAAPWETPIRLHRNFEFFKSLSDGKGYVLRQPAHLVYYDAFDPVAQPELWSPAVFEKLYGQLAAGALLVTYCCKGSVQRALRSAGFGIEKLPGPPGKREILRAKKQVAAGPIRQT